MRANFSSVTLTAKSYLAKKVDEQNSLIMHLWKLQHDRAAAPRWRL